jgi:5'-methylthioadenosine nucleosidase
VSSGNSLNCTELDRATLDASGAHVKEMECAAIAYVAHLFKTPFLAVKAITDIVDGDRTSGACGGNAERVA